MVNPAELKGADYNPRTMPPAEMAALKRSIKEMGFVENIVANKKKGRENIVIGGHQRLKAALELGMETVPVFYVELDEAQEKVLNLALNRISGRWDDDKLGQIIYDLKNNDLIKASGFGEDEISKIIDSLALEDDEMNETEKEVVEAESKPGEIYELGRHRLICGDTTDPEVWQKLLDGKKADLIFTDPPYNVNYHSKHEGLMDDEKESIKNDNLTDVEFNDLINKSFRNMMDFVKNGASFYICSGWSSYPQFLKSMIENGFVHSGVIIWVKNTGSMGFNDYRYKHEWVVKAKKDTGKPKGGGMIYGWKAGASHKFYGGRDEFDVWEMPRKSVVNYLHPTEKPDWLAMRAMRNSSRIDAVVVDPFGGSGSTLIAAEKTGRVARLIELDPKFCDVIRKRWAEYNNKILTLKND